jgi:hypothetical protein
MEQQSDSQINHYAGEDERRSSVGTIVDRRNPMT